MTDINVVADKVGKICSKLTIIERQEFEDKPNPYAETRMARFLKKRFSELRDEGVSLNEIARRLGYKRGNILTMMQNGYIPVPLSQVIPIARAIGADESSMLLMALEQQFVGDLSVVRKIFSRLVSEDEAETLHVLRNAIGGPLSELKDRKLDLVLGIISGDIPENRIVSHEESLFLEKLKECGVRFKIFSNDVIKKVSRILFAESQ